MRSYFKKIQHKITSKSLPHLIMIVIIVIQGILLLQFELPAAAPKKQETSRPVSAPLVSKQNLNRATNDIRSILDAMRRLNSDTGVWPGGCAPLQPNGIEIWDLGSADAGLIKAPQDESHPWSGGECLWSENAKSRWKGPYLEHLPVDPWGRNYWFDPDYWGRSGATAQYQDLRTITTFGCPAGQDGIVIGSFGPNGLQYDCDDIVFMLVIKGY